MGDTLRRYWVPALLASEIPGPDCAPARVKLLGEDLVAFRDSGGRIGLLDELCPHRLASLYFGRNEECGLRCVYHGWKFDVSGACTDMMNEPAENDFKHKIHTTAYPTVDLGGIIWARILGPPRKNAARAEFAWTQVPESPPSRHQGDQNNWLQALEGGLDVARSDHAPDADRRDDAWRDQTLQSVRARQGAETGRRSDRLRLSICRHTAAGRRAEMHIRAYHFILPFHPDPPIGVRTGQPLDAGHIWVPMDDETTMVFNWSFLKGDGELTEEDRLERGIGNGPLHVDQTTFRSYANKANNYLIDRDVQKSETFTGIEGINAQDQAIRKHGDGRRPLARARVRPTRRSSSCARSCATPFASSKPAAPPTDWAPYHLRAGEGVLPRDADWRQELTPTMRRNESCRRYSRHGRVKRGSSWLGPAFRRRIMSHRKAIPIRPRTHD